MMNPHRNEIIRWANSPEGTGVWVRHKDLNNWELYKEIIKWDPELYYIVDDPWAPFRKAEIDGIPIYIKNIDNKWVLLKHSVSNNMDINHLSLDGKTDNSWKGRVEDELEDLVDKMIKLKKYLQRNETKAGADIQYDLLYTQYNVMKSYADILQMRLNV